MEHRCPLATYGCHFSARRLFPDDAGHTVRFDKDHESFGITALERQEQQKPARKQPKQVARAPLPKKKSSNPLAHKRSLMDMPVEILLKIMGYLDSFTYVRTSSHPSHAISSRIIVSLQFKPRLGEQPPPKGSLLRHVGPARLRLPAVGADKGGGRRQD